MIVPLSVPGEEATVQVFGKVYNIPRKQATYGDAGLTYTYSGIRRMASPWTPTLEYIRDAVTTTTGQKFNFVLVNRWEMNVNFGNGPPAEWVSSSFSTRYKDGLDHVGEHRDDEKELDPLCPIASVSLGAARDFIFRHRDARGKMIRRQIEPVKLELAHGSLLLMNPPTNTFWYHSLPVRKKISLPRINLTFRRIQRKKWARQRPKEEDLTRSVRIKKLRALDRKLGAAFKSSLLWHDSFNYTFNTWKQSILQLANTQNLTTIH